MMTNEKKQRRLAMILTLILLASVFMFIPGAWAAMDDKEKVNTVMEIIHAVLKYTTMIIGVITLLTGIVSFVISKQNDNGPDEHKAIVKMAVGLILIMLFTLIINENMWDKLVEMID